ncbi:hypothetical protein UO65_1918 [Actinokineospora spheciospongiae]|uniref:DUF6542 domain-containing protein n=1 Tax=Actinokineospora spheciospongiae TaxID=909613 RepID=W7J1I4_9PSEU|nr:DUF6542 domain-containing protein [Actinokineospora spheciospongiae]EWC62796.1 hypothetical protein UO65_1918 [Actinokineospora spheciospongiae]
MTATRDRQSDLDDDRAGPAWDERPLFGASRGLPWWGAVLLALALSAIAAVVDMQRQETLGGIYQGGFVLGCVAAVCLVRRRNLFGPMVQPPLVFAVTAAGALIALSPDEGSGRKQLLITVAFPLTSNFPTMAITTAVCVAIGVARLLRQRDPARDTGDRGADDAAPRERKPRQETRERRPRPPREEAKREPRPDRGPRDPNRKPTTRKPRPE